jgi:hypothetical protein
MAFTARLGTNLSMPGNIALGGGIFNPVRIVNLAPATLTFSGNIPSVIIKRLLYSGAATVIVQKRVTVKTQKRPVVAIAQKRGQVLKVVQRTTTQLDTQPYQIDMAITETYPYQADVTQYLATGDSISTITAVLTLTSTGAAAPTGWQGTISTAGNIIQVPIIGSFLRLGQSYLLAVTFTANTGKILTLLSQVNVIN